MDEGVNHKISMRRSDRHARESTRDRGVHMVQQAQVSIVVGVHVDQRCGHDAEDDLGRMCRSW